MSEIPAAVKARLPFLQGVLPRTRREALGDLLAGLTLAALAIPEVMGYARIAGMPIVTGLYTLLFPLAVYALLGSSRHLVVGADSATAAIMAASLAPLAAVGSPAYVALACALAMLTGIALLLARAVHLGFLADFMSRTVLVGFLTGVGIHVAVRQLGGMLGVSDGGGGVLPALWRVASQLRSTNPWTLGVAVLVLATVIVGRRANPRFPAALIAVAGAIAASFALDLPAHGVAVLGSVAGGLPRVALPAVSLQQAGLLLATSASLTLVVLTQSAATSRAYAIKNGDAFDEDVDLVGLAAANLAAGLTGTFVVNGSPTKTEMVEDAGGRSQLAQLAAGAVVLVVLLALTGPLARLPLAVLSAVVFLIGVRLVDIPHLAAVYRVARLEFWVALATAAIVVLWGVEQGIVLAIVLSVLVQLRHAYRPHDYVLVREGDGHWHSRAVASGAQAEPGVVVYRFGASLFYANANHFDAEVRRLVKSAKPPLTALVLSAEAIGDIDYSAAEMLRTLVRDLQHAGLRVIVTDVAHNVKSELYRYDLAYVIGEEHVHHGLTDAMTDALGQSEGSTKER